MGDFKSGLRRNMQERMLKEKGCMRHFLPEHELYAVFTEDVVDQLLQKAFHQTISTTIAVLSTKRVGKYWLFFCIIVMRISSESSLSRIC